MRPRQNNDGAFVGLMIFLAVGVWIIYGRYH